MDSFASRLGALMAEQDLGVRAVARRVPCDPGLISRLRRGLGQPSPKIARRLDAVLGADGELASLATPASSGRTLAVTAARRPSRAVEALQVAANGTGDGPGFAEDGLTELVRYYAHAVAVTPSVAVYDELVSARSFAATLLDPGGRARRTDLTVTTGWLSSLLAISATDLGDHAAALVWCADTERRGREAGFPELPAWAALTRSLIAWYQQDPVRSSAAARRGQAAAPAGTVAVKLAAQEMRCLAAAGEGEIDEAAAAGTAALEAGHLVWPTMVLAGKLDRSLTAKSPGSAHTAGFRARYIDAGRRLTLPAAPAGGGDAGE